MTTLTTTNAGWTARFRNIFKPRDIFLHDGKSLRRFTIGAGVQMAAALAAFVLLAWSALATFAAIDAMNGDVARMERQVAQMEADVAALRNQTRQHAATLERRQQFLATMLRGDASADQLAALMPRRGAARPAAVAQALCPGRGDAAPGRRRRPATPPASASSATASAIRDDRHQPEPALRTRPTRARWAARSRRSPRARTPIRASASSSPPGGSSTSSSRAPPPSPRPTRSATRSTFTSGYGVRSDPFRGRAAMHAGIDLAGPYGTPIYATADGIVGQAEYNRGGYGNLVEINHGQGIQTRYGHLSRYAASAGQRVRRGQLIGYMGSTGRSTGSHLHYEVRIDGRAVNPVPFITQAAAIAQSAGRQRARHAARDRRPDRRPGGRRAPLSIHKLGRGLQRPKASPATAGPFLLWGVVSQCECPPCAQSSPVSIWKVEWPMPKRCAMPCAQSARKASPGKPPGMTRCAVSANSVVLIGQMWRSWIRATPGRAPRCASTASGSMPRGTPASAMVTDSRSMSTEAIRMIAATIRLAIGSTQTQPVSGMRDAGDDHARRDQGVGDHVQIGAAHVEVALAAAREHEGGGAVHEDADRRRRPSPSRPRPRPG